MQLNFTT